MKLNKQIVFSRVWDMVYDQAVAQLTNHDYGRARNLVRDMVSINVYVQVRNQIWSELDAAT